MWCQKDLVFELQTKKMLLSSPSYIYTQGGTELTSNQTWLEIANAMNAEASNGRKCCHRSIYARYSLFLAPGITHESRKKVLDAAAGKAFPQLQLQGDDGDVIEGQRERLTPLQQGNPALVPLKTEAKPVMESGVVLGPSRSFEENERWKGIAAGLGEEEEG
jgi:hypothetical protein